MNIYFSNKLLLRMPVFWDVTQSCRHLAEEKNPWLNCCENPNTRKLFHNFPSCELTQWLFCYEDNTRAQRIKIAYRNHMQFGIKIS